MTAAAKTVIPVTDLRPGDVLVRLTTGRDMRGTVQSVRPDPEWANYLEVITTCGPALYRTTSNVYIEVRP